MRCDMLVLLSTSSMVKSDMDAIERGFVDVFQKAGGIFQYFNVIQENKQAIKTSSDVQIINKLLRKVVGNDKYANLRTINERFLSEDLNAIEVGRQKAGLPADFNRLFARSHLNENRLKGIRFGMEQRARLYSGNKTELLNTDKKPNVFYTGFLD